MPLGFEDISDAGDVARAIAELKAMKPDLRKAVVKINEGFSGEGNRSSTSRTVLRVRRSCHGSGRVCRIWHLKPAT
jgi:hypothetical protein